MISELLESARGLAPSIVADRPSMVVAVMAPTSRLGIRAMRAAISAAPRRMPGSMFGLHASSCAATSWSGRREMPVYSPMSGTVFAYSSWGTMS